MKNIPRIDIKTVNELTTHILLNYNPIILSDILKMYDHYYTNWDWKKGWSIIDYLNYRGELGELFQTLKKVTQK